MAPNSETQKPRVYAAGYPQAHATEMPSKAAARAPLSPKLGDPSQDTLDLKEFAIAPMPKMFFQYVDSLHRQGRYRPRVRPKDLEDLEGTPRQHNRDTTEVANIWDPDEEPITEGENGIERKDIRSGHGGVSKAAALLPSFLQ